MKRENITSGTKWETEVGYSRVVKIGNLVFVSGTTSVDEDGNIIGAGDVYTQTKFVLQKIEKTLKEAGAGLTDVVRTRMFVKDINQWEKIGKAHGEFFRDIKPASTMVEVSSLIDNDLSVEIEVDAVIIE